MAVANWTGFTLTLGTTGLTIKVRSWNWDPPEKAVLDITHQGSSQPGTREHGGREFLTGKLTDPGFWEFEILIEPTTNWPVGATAAFETLTLQPPSDVCSGAFVASGKLLGPPVLSPGIDTEPVGRIRFKLTGKVSMPSS